MVSASSSPPLFDGHNDVLLRLYLDSQEGGLEARSQQVRRFLEGREGGHLDLPRARAGGLWGGLFAVFVPSPGDSGRPDFRAAKTADGYRLPRAGRLSQDEAAAATDQMIALLESLIEASDGDVFLARTGQDLVRARAEGPLAAVLHFEGAESIRPDLDNLPAYHERGLRSLGPVWSRSNDFGHGVPFAYPASPDEGPGLTDAGRALVSACHDLGILVDLAHLNERGFWDVAELAGPGLVVSHACAHRLCPTARNLTDDQIRAVGDSGGLVGVNLHVGDLREDGRWRPETPLEIWARHVETVIELAGVEHVALGSDFDGALMPRELGDASGLPRLLEVLRDRGWSDTDLEAFAWRNWSRVLAHAWRETPADGLRVP